MPAQHRPYRSRSRTPLQTTAAIVSAAEAEFAANGLAGARMERVAQGAGITKQLIHRYFGSKELLYAYLVNIVADHPDHSHLLLDYDKMEPKDAIASFFGGVFDLYRDNPNLARFAQHQNIHENRSPNAWKKARAQVDDLVQKLDGILARGAQSGAFATGLNAGGVFLAGVSITVHYFFNRALFSLVHFDCGSDDLDQTIEEAWRAYALEFISSAIEAPAGASR